MATKKSNKKHLPLENQKEQRMYEHIKEQSEKTGKYKGREKEVAARTVMKHHREHGHSKNK
jgi:predicted transposase YdaD